MRVSRITLNRESYGKQKGEYTGDIEFSSNTGTIIRIKINSAVAKDILNASLKEIRALARENSVEVLTEIADATNLTDKEDDEPKQD